MPISRFLGAVLSLGTCDYRPGYKHSVPNARAPTPLWIHEIMFIITKLRMLCVSRSCQMDLWNRLRIRKLAIPAILKHRVRAANIQSFERENTRTFECIHAIKTQWSVCSFSLMTLKSAWTLPCETARAALAFYMTILVLSRSLDNRESWILMSSKAT